MKNFVVILALFSCVSSFAKEDESLETKVGKCVDERLDRVCGEFGSIQCMNTLQDICLDMAKNPSSFVAQSKLDSLQKQYGKKRPPAGLPSKSGPAAGKPVQDNR